MNPPETTTTGNRTTTTGNETTTTGNQTTASGSQLLDVVDQAVMNGQAMQRDPG